NLRVPLDELRAAAKETTGGFTLEEMEKDYILRVLRDTGGVVSSAAIRLGMPRNTLNAMMKKLGITRRDF
ncbi:MAG: helix-turn-helix domain-containing protein, partial [Acidobacteriota bacterium]